MIWLLFLFACDGCSTQSEWMRACADTCKPAGVHRFEVTQINGYLEPLCTCNPPTTATP